MEQTAAPPQPPPPSATTAATTAGVTPSVPATHPDSVDTSASPRNNDFWGEDNSLYQSNNGYMAAAVPGGVTKLRLMCSYSGHIVPRPHDKTLCYIGGVTRIVVVDRHTSLSDLTHRISKTLFRSSVPSTTGAFTLKYQLPSEDLDSLISVTTDEDLENMIDEYDRLNSSTNVTKSSRLRLFLFPSKPESVTSIGSLLESTKKSEDWFLNALNGTSSGFSDTSSVNGLLLGLEDDISIPEKKDASNDSVIGKIVGGNNSVQDIQSVPDSPMLDNLSSFGSASSIPSLANLPPVRVNADEQQKVGVGIEEQFSHISVQQQQIKHQDDVSFLTAPAPVVITGVPVISKVPITENPNRVLSEDEKLEQSFQLAYLKQQQQQQQQQQYQQKQSMAFDLHSPGSVSSDGSITNPLSRRNPPTVYQDPASQSQFSTNNNNRASDPSNIHDQKSRIHDQQHPQMHHQPQFIHSAVPPPQYIHHHHPSGVVPMGSYYQMYPSQAPNNQHNIVYYMPAVSAPPTNQVPPPTSLFTGSRTVQPATKTESPAGMYRAPATQQRQVQPQYVNYTGGNFAYEFTDPSKQGQHVYYATPHAHQIPPQSAAQYQTMASNLPVDPGSLLQTDKQQLRTTPQT